jgi:coenzyme F420 biosynthesis associated uncharacterized protein
LSLVDWSLAGRIAVAVAGNAEPPPAPVGLEATCERAAAAIVDYTGLEVGEDLPAPEWVDRAEWTRVNLDVMRRALVPLERRIAEGPQAGALSRPAMAAMRRLLGIQAGAIVGYASRRVLGQYEPGLGGGEPRPRLLFVGPNLGEAGAGIGDEPDRVLAWIATHEVTHAVQFAAVPWLRERIAELVGEVLERARPTPDVGALVSALPRLLRSDPRRLIDELRRADPMLMLAPAGARETIEQVQATMSAVEGYAEHVMDAAPVDLEGVAAMRARLEARRSERSTIARLIGWLLGFELKLRQYRDGKRFCDEIATAQGIGRLNLAWASPDRLPTLAELREPGQWLARTEATVRVLTDSP